jgi:molecular chaperone HtpG
VTATVPSETREFQAETKQLLDLVIHSLYTNKDIFLRELISNASDALDRIRFESLTAPDLLGESETLEIRLDTDIGARSLSVSDNGIGMSREEVISNIGSIAKSGTRDLVQKVKEAKGGQAPLDLIGNFGVGFYSAFMVADRVVVETVRAGESEATRWESRADGTYTISAGTRRSRGTVVTLHLKPPDPEAGIQDYIDEWTLESIVKRYSDFVNYPIRHKVTREKKETDEKGIVKPDGTTTIVTDDKTLNSQMPIWVRSESEVSAEDYDEFYRQISGDWEKPMLRFSFKAEGVSEYRTLVYVPAASPQDLYFYNSDFGLRLYARRVLIMDRCEEVLPRFLRFFRGIVDAADLPLNVSRQMLQENRHIAQIRKWLTRKALDSLAKLQKDEPEKYLAFWKEYGRAVKEGVASEFQHKDRIAELMLFESSADPRAMTTFAGYVDRMKEGQEDIYYLSGESRTMCENSPLLEGFLAKGYEVLFLTDGVDELALQYLPEYQGKKLKSVAKADANLGSADEKKEAEAKLKASSEKLKGLTASLAEALKSQVKQVRLSNRLTESPACLAAEEHDMSPQMERLMRMSQGESAPRQRRILELNPSHQIVQRLQARYQVSADDPQIAEYAELLYGYAALAEGLDLPDAARFNKLLASLMARDA